MADDRKTVLIVDDMPSIIEIHAGALQADYRILAATTGEQALAIARGENPPDVILLDLLIPGMNGTEIARALKADAGTRAIPIILVSALSDDAEAELMDLACATLRKPVARDTLQATVARALA